MAASDKHNQAPRGMRGTLFLSLGALGVAFGDIGTSPIYALSTAIKDGGRGVDDVVGVASLVIWTLTIVVSVKYLLVVVRADNHGEGGALALFAQLPARIRHARPGTKYVPLFFLMLLAAAFLFADGLITPAISVLSAVEGLSTINTAWTSLEVPITVVILALLFALQARGTGFIGKIFGPVMVFWFGTLAVLGLGAIVATPEALKAINPVYAAEFIGRHGLFTLFVMASVILAVTGSESLYADLGHFGRRPIRISWFSLVFPALLLSYLGQAAKAISDPTNIDTLFFSLSGDNVGVRIYLVLLSTAATIIASQALISGVGSIANQSMQLGLLTRMRVVHTSSKYYGQIYVPLINLILALGSISLVVAFGSSAALASAYAFATAGTMLITTIALFWVSRERWHWKRRYTVSLLSLFLLFDITFVLSTSTKLLHGAWLPLVVGFVVASIMWIWRKGRLVMEAKLAQLSISWDDVVAHRASEDVAIIPMTGIYLSALPNVVPQALEEQVTLMRNMPETIVVLNIASTPEPYNRKPALIEKVNDFTTRITLYSGFMDNRDVPRSLRNREIAKIFSEKDAVYFVSKRDFTDKNKSSLNKIERLIFSSMHRNASAIDHFLKLPSRRVATISVTLEI